MNLSPELLPDPDDDAAKKKNTLFTGEARISSDYARRERELVEKVRARIADLPRGGTNHRGFSKIMENLDIEISEGSNRELDIAIAKARLGGIGYGPTGYK